MMRKEKGKNTIPSAYLLHVLISGVHNVVTVCNLKFASILQMRSYNFVKLCDVTGSPNYVQKHFAR